MSEFPIVHLDSENDKAVIHWVHENFPVPLAVIIKDLYTTEPFPKTVGTLAICDHYGSKVISQLKELQEKGILNRITFIGFKYFNEMSWIIQDFPILRRKRLL